MHNPYTISINRLHWGVIMNQTIKKRIEEIKQGKVPEAFKLTKSGILPFSWDSRKLKKLVIPIQEKAQNLKFEVLSITAGVGFVNQADKFGKVIAGAQYQKYTVLRKGDFSYNKGNSKTYPQGCIYMLEDRNEAAVPNVFISFRFKHGIHTYYYKHLFINGFLSRQLYRYINAGVRNDGLLNLYNDDFYNCELPVPPLPEQDKIAEILSTWDKAVELKEKLIEEKKRQKKWLLENLLNPENGVRLPGFEGEWEDVSLQDCTLNKGEYGLNAPACEYKEGLPRYIRITDIDEKGRYISSNEAYVDSDNSFQFFLKHNDLLFVRTGSTVGKTYLYNEKDGHLIFAGFLIRFSINCTKCNPIFIKTIFDTIDYWKWVKIISARSGQPGINADEYSKYRFRIPVSLKEQAAIANLLSTADKEIDLLEQELEQLQKQKKALMQLLLTGIIRVNCNST